MLKFNKLSELKEIFEQHITISIIAEDFVAFDAQEDVDKCFAYSEEHKFDIVGVKENGRIIGYSRLSKQDTGVLGEHRIEFSEDEVVTSDAPLHEAVNILAKQPYIFVREQQSGDIFGIITRADLYKHAFRIWLYGLISVLEIHMFELIRLSYPGESWTHKLSWHRRRKVRKIHNKRKKRNEDIELLYCTEFCDKKILIHKSKVALKATGFGSKSKFAKSLKNIEELRNEVAHSCKVSKKRWEDVSELCKQAESIINNVEKFLTNKN